MKVVSWRPLERGESMKGFATLELASGLRLIECGYHSRQDGSKWVLMPAKSFKKDDGATAWVALIDFSSRAVRDAFVKQAVTAIEKYLAEYGDKKPTVNEAEELPF